MNRKSIYDDAPRKNRKQNAALALSGLIFLFLLIPSAQARQAGLTVDSDLVIPVRDISATATFYPVQINGDIAVFFAVRAPDNSIRIVVDACQACGPAGFRQEGEYFACKSCEQKFHVSVLEKKQGGCNPIPVGDANKVIGADSIVLKKNFLQKVTTSKFAKSRK